MIYRIVLGLLVVGLTVAAFLLAPETPPETSQQTTPSATPSSQQDEGLKGFKIP
jgi:hypothetical protein